MCQSLLDHLVVTTAVDMAVVVMAAVVLVVAALGMLALAVTTLVGVTKLWIGPPERRRPARGWPKRY